MGNVANVGLMAKAEYGSHDKTFEIEEAEAFGLWGR